MTDPSPLGEAPRLKRLLRAVDLLRRTVIEGIATASVTFTGKTTLPSEHWAMMVQYAAGEEINAALKDVEQFLAEGAARRGPQPESIGAPTIEGDRIICSHCKATLYSIVKARPRPCQDDEPEAAPLVRSSAPPQQNPLQVGQCQEHHRTGQRCELQAPHDGEMHDSGDYKWPNVGLPPHPFTPSSSDDSICAVCGGWLTDPHESNR